VRKLSSSMMCNEDEVLYFFAKIKVLYDHVQCCLV